VHNTFVLLISILTPLKRIINFFQILKKTTMKFKTTYSLGIYVSAFIMLGFTMFAQSPTDPAKNFNVFTLGNTTLKTNESQGPIAIGGDLTIEGSYQVATQNAGTFEVNSLKIGLLVNGKVNYQSGSALKVNSNGYVKIGNSTGSTVWYADPNNATPPIKITPNSNYNSSPIIMLQASAPTLAVSVNNNPVFQPDLLDFASAFQTMKASSISISQNTQTVKLTDPNGLSIPNTNLPNQVKINLQNGLNYWNISAADLNAVQVLDFTSNKPTATKVLIINVDAAGTFDWKVWNQTGISFENCPYIMYNFYNTTKLNITNGSGIKGTVFAPFADIAKGSGNQSNIEGQVIANSFSHTGGAVHYAIFSPAAAGVAPTANCSVANATQCLSGNFFKFSNGTTPIQANLPLTYLWEFGDGTTSTAENPTKVYAAAGAYIVKLTATNGKGSSSKTVITNVNSPTNASVSQSTLSNVVGLVTKKFVLNNSSGFTNYSWSVSNGGSGLFSNQSTVNFAFTQVGVYQVIVTGTNDKGCSSTTIIPVSIDAIVPGVAPTANFSVANSTQCLATNSFNFANTTTPIQANLPLTYFWDFADGTTSTAENPTKVYSVAGSYSVKLTATNSIGSNTKAMKVMVVNATNAAVSQSTLSKVNGVITKKFVLNNSFGFTNYSWSVSNGGTGLFSNQSTVNFEFTQAGVYQVTVTGIDDKGCSSTTIIPVSISFTDVGIAPTSDFSIDNSTQCLATNSFNFTNTTSPIQANLPFTYLWDFGDGTTSTSLSPTKIYSVAGTYSVRLTVTNSIGSSIKAITVTVNSSTNAFVSQSTLSKVPGAITKKIVLNNSSAFTNYSWSVSNGGTGLFSNQNTVNFSFTQAGDYEVTISGVNTKGCISSTVIPVSISSLDLGAALTANFTVSNLSQCLATNSFNFTNATTPIQAGLPITYLWEFGDGTTNTSLSPTKVYAAAGIYNVKLTATNSIGSSSKTIQVFVNSATDAIVSQSTLLNVPGSITKQFVLSNSSSFTNYSWSVSNGGNGLFSNQNTVNFAFTQAGVYQITVSGFDNNGCSSATLIPVAISTLDVAVAPTTDFSVANSIQCLTNNSFDFVNATTPLQAGLPVTYLWEFGDGTTSTFLNPTKVYSASGVYNVKLTATNGVGFTSKTVQVTVNSSTDAIVSQSTLSNAAGTLTKQFVFSNSIDFTNYSWSVSNGGTALLSNQNTVTFPFTQAGYYEVTITGTNGKGCSSSTIIPVTIASNEVNTGNSGGLESESLGDIMSKQYVGRKMSSVPTEFVKNDAAKFDKKQLVKESSSSQKVKKEFTLAEMFPSTLEKGDAAHITSPTDILDYTIAQEVLSVDFSLKGSTKAVVLGVRTKDKVYNHTKASCDRLRSAEILNVKTIKVGGYNFLMQTIKQRNNVIEYAVSFSVGKNYTDTGYTLQSNWFVKEYTTFKDVYNFQVWATLPEQTTKLVNDILNNLKSSMPLVQSEIQKLPKTFASKVSREGNELVLKLKSTAVGRSIEITMDQNYSETNGFTERYNPLQSKIEQTIRLNVADAYEFDGLIRVEGEIQDAFYHADGNWGLDYDPKYTTIKKYRVSNDLTRATTDDDMLINRNVNIEVFSEDDYATLYKSLLPGQIAADYNDYKFVTFKAKGSGLMELGLIKASVENWKHQYKAMINIGEEEQTYYIPFKFFTSAKSKEMINANDLTMLTFTFLPVEAKTKNLDLTISDLKFTKKAPEGYEDLLHTMKNEFLVYPNPSLGNVKCVLFSDVSATATVSLYDMTGKVVHSSNVKLNEGKNELDFNFNVPKGVMLLDIKNEKTSFGKSKIVFK
jgi:choice-of-anchor A domain-containing protein